MKLGVRTRFFGVTILLVIFVLFSSGYWLLGQLRLEFENRLETEMSGYVRAAREAVETSREPSTVAAMDPLADRLGAAMKVRVTIIGADGRLLGDSKLSADEVRKGENHAERPERLDAVTENYGKVTRYSNTLRKEMFYVAVKYERDAGPGVVRVAMPLAQIGTLEDQLRVVLILAGTLAVGLTLLSGALTSHLLSRTLRRLVERARRLAERRGISIASPVGDEIDALARSLNRLSEDLERMLDTLATERDRFGAVLEGMADGVLTLDESMTIRLINPAAISLFQLSKDPTDAPLVDSIRVPELLALCQEATTHDAGETVGEFELNFREPRSLLVRAAYQPKTGGIVVVVNDITEMRRLEKMRRDFVANVSHELRTPVSVIRANAETLTAGALKDVERAPLFVDGILRNSERLSGLISDLLDLSKIEAGQLNFELKPVSVADSARRAVETLQHRTEEKSMTMLVEIDESVLVYVDEMALDQIMLNYVENASKYTPAGGTIICKAEEEKGQVRIEVHDDGPGIDLHHRPRLFERFYRVDSGRAKNMGGTGLGLAIVKHLAAAMQGQVGMEGREPHGSIFWVSLPSSAETQVLQGTLF
ncbi:MAG: ATP-binding protein [Myxococcota bacterium]|nr:ATP-binding protein [Myxococcota bacterium]